MAKKTDLQDLLGDWAELNRQIMHLKESQIETLMETEKSGKSRARVLMRLYHRYSKLRGSREKIELLKAARA